MALNYGTLINGTSQAPTPSPLIPLLVPGQHTSRPLPEKWEKPSFYRNRLQRFPRTTRPPITARIGIDRFLGEKHTVSLQVAMEKNAVPYSAPGMTRFFGEKGIVDSTTSQVNNSLNPQTNITGSLQYKWKVKEGRNFSASLHTARLRTNTEDLYTIENKDSKGQLTRPSPFFRNFILTIPP
ncbi:hypothetical protein [Chitinophaga sp. MD30]|uniref:hypothetical protein n=1 Tax=Chitinophaga sp. MD30 TaxID=2033437 RepID=UPI0012FE4C16|nr:hypothetical protein [Chitinophaga sp. MD30]